jgi:hypothetical protein
MSFAQATQPSAWFWSTGSAWGTVQQSPDGPGAPSVRLEVLAGEVRVDRVTVGAYDFAPKTAGLLTEDTSYELEPAPAG